MLFVNVPTRHGKKKLMFEMERIEWGKDNSDRLSPQSLGSLTFSLRKVLPSVILFSVFTFKMDNLLVKSLIPPRHKYFAQ